MTKLILTCWFEPIYDGYWHGVLRRSRRRSVYVNQVHLRRFYCPIFVSVMRNMRATPITMDVYTYLSIFARFVVYPAGVPIDRSYVIHMQTPNSQDTAI